MISVLGHRGPSRQSKDPGVASAGRRSNSGRCWRIPQERVAERLALAHARKAKRVGESRTRRVCAEAETYSMCTVYQILKGIGNRIVFSRRPPTAAKFP